MGRGRDSDDGNAARQGQHTGQQTPYGGGPYGAGPAGGHGGTPGHGPGGQGGYGGGWDGRQWQGGQGSQGGPGGTDEPEYLGGHPPQGQGRPYPGQGQGRPHPGQPYPGQSPAQPYPQGGHGQPGPSYDPYGHPGQGQGPGQGPGQGRSPGQGPGPGGTQQFGIGEAPDAYPTHGGPRYGDDSYDDGYGQGHGDDDAYGDAHTYNGPPAPPPGPKLHWKDLLKGLVLRPSATFWQMRDHAMWVPAVLVTFIYGLLAVFGFDKAREDVLNATFANSIPLVLVAGVIVLISGLILGAVTHTLARQLGGDGLWQPTIGLSMLIMSITDAPRLVIAVFLGGDNPVVQLLGWVTWLLAGVLFTSMVSKSHDLPWPKALGASAIQLIALLSIIKLGTL